MSDIFDRKLLRKNQKRYQEYFSDHDFLYREAADYMLHDIESLKKDFDSVLQICGKDRYINDYIAKIKNVKQKICASYINFNFSDIVFDEEDLPFKEESFDLIVSNLNLHFINKLPQFLMQAKALLKKDGFFIASFFGENNLIDLKKAVFEAEEEVLGGFSARFMPVIDLQSAARLLQKSGFNDPVSGLDIVDVEYGSVEKILQDIKYMGQGNILQKRAKKMSNRKFFNEIYNNYAKIATNSNDLLNVRYEIIIISGWK